MGLSENVGDVDIKARVHSWKSLYAPSSRQDETGLSSYIKIAVASDTFTPNKIDSSFPHARAIRLDEELPWLHRTALEGSLSAVCRKTPASMSPSSYDGDSTGEYQIQLHPKTIDGIINTLRRANLEERTSVESVVLHPGIEFDRLPELSELIKPDSLTLLDTDELDVKQAALFSDTVIDLGMVIEDGSKAQMFTKCYPKLERLRISAHHLQNRLGLLQACLNPELTHLVLHSFAIGEMFRRGLVTRLSHIRETPFQYLQLSTIDAKNVALDLSAIADAANRVYVLVKDAPDITLNAQQVLDNAKSFKAGIVWVRREFASEHLEIPIHSDFCPEFSSETDPDDIYRDAEPPYLAQLRIVYSNPSLNFTGRSFLYPDGNYLQGYYTPKSFDRTIQHYYGNTETDSERV